MTIKEVEERTGLSRANIRFYEDEGLIFPQRLPNGYRDYSEKDILDLEKIKLLRQLEMDINTIRLVQNGRLSLDQALFGQLNRLEGERSALTRAVDVCRAMGSARVDYASLQPGRWLKELEEPVRPAVTAPPTQPPPMTVKERYFLTHGAADHPWMRWLARGVDMGIYRTLFHFVALAGFRWYSLADPGLLAEIAMNVALLLFTFLVEPLWLHYWGWTPGKWIFGLKVRDRNGEKLTLSQAWQRGWRVAVEGYCLYIPLLWLLGFWRGRRCCVKGEDCPWDADERYHYTQEDRRLFGLMWLGAEVVQVAVLVLAVMMMTLPVNRGPLTVAEFAENYNEILICADQDGRGMDLDENGRWRPRAEQANTVYIDLTDGKTVWHEPEYTLTDGAVTAVTLRMESNDTWRGNGGDLRVTAAILALAGSTDQSGLFTYGRSQRVEQWETLDGVFWNTSYEHMGLRVEQVLDYEGYRVVTGILYSKGTGDTHLERTVTISLIGSD